MKTPRSLDVLGETRRALRILRRVESYLAAAEKRERKMQLARQQREHDEREANKERAEI